MKVAKGHLCQATAYFLNVSIDSFRFHNFKETVAITEECRSLLKLMGMSPYESVLIAHTNLLEAKITQRYIKNWVYYSDYMEELREKSDRLFASACVLFERHFGEDNHFLAESLIERGRNILEEDAQWGLRLIQEGARILNKLFNEDHLLVLKAQVFLGYAYFHYDSFKEAEQIYMNCLERVVAKFGPYYHALVPLLYKYIIKLYIKVKYLEGFDYAMTSIINYSQRFENWKSVRIIELAEEKAELQNREKFGEKDGPKLPQIPPDSCNEYVSSLLQSVIE